jgi:hypothetical protein
VKNPVSSLCFFHEMQLVFRYVAARDEPRAAAALATFKQHSQSRKAIEDVGVTHVVVRVEIDGLCDSSGAFMGGEMRRAGSPSIASVWRRVRVATNLTLEEFAQQVLCPAMGWWGPRCTLTPPDPQLKGAWYPGGFNPCTYQVKKPVSKCAFQMQRAPLTGWTPNYHAYAFRRKPPPAGGPVRVECS